MMGPLLPLGCSSTPASVPALGQFLLRNAGVRECPPCHDPARAQSWRWVRLREELSWVGFWSFIHLASSTGHLLGGKAIARGDEGASCLVGSGCEQVGTRMDGMDE